MRSVAGFLVAAAIVALTHAQSDTPKETPKSAGEKCGTQETDFAPCIARERADSLFKHCCRQYAPDGCQSLCQYETDELTARNLVMFLS